MNQSLKSFMYYVLMPILVVLLMVFLVDYFYLCDLEKSVNTIFIFIQSTAIITAGLWAYNKFDWEKRAENAIKIKAFLIEYKSYFDNFASQYRVNADKKDVSVDPWLQYILSILPKRNEIFKNINLAIYLPKKIRVKLFDLLDFSINQNKNPKNEDLNKNWRKFEDEIVEINKELDDLISK